MHSNAISSSNQERTAQKEAIQAFGWRRGSFSDQPHRLEAKEKLLSFGRCPAEKAKKAREFAREMTAEGPDLGEEKKRTRENQLREREQTFDRLARYYLEKQAREGRTPSPLRKIAGCLYGLRRIWRDASCRHQCPNQFESAAQG